MIKVIQIATLSDNYSYIIVDAVSKLNACIDPSVSGTIENFLEKNDLILDYIINTHHHNDHVGGNLELKKKYNCKIIGNLKDQERIPGIDIKLKDNDIFKLGESEFKVIDTPGHTVGHVCYYFKEDKVLFSGDTLFSMGCGRLFEGSATQMVKSLKKLRSLPGETKIYCGHEYTQSNANFALHLSPRNNKLKEKVIKIEKTRKKKLSTIPSSIEEEVLLNPFLNFDNSNFIKEIGLENVNDYENFRKIRVMKDEF